MDAKQFKLFRQITLDYFDKLAPGDEPAMAEPYLAFGDPVLADYTSLVEIRGEYDGCIYITSPTAMLEQLLGVHGEPEVSERTVRDMCRELSNVLAGNASRAFGGHWEISVPVSLGPSDLDRRPFPESAFVMPIDWRGARSLLVVALSAPRH